MVDGLDVRILGPGDLGVLLGEVAPGTFDGPVDPRWARAVLEAPDQHLAVALDGARVVGFAMGVRYAEPDKAPALYVDEVGTADAYRRRGVATALMRALLSVDPGERPTAEAVLAHAWMRAGAHATDAPRDQARRSSAW